MGAPKLATGFTIRLKSSNIFQEAERIYQKKYLEKKSGFSYKESDIKKYNKIYRVSEPGCMGGAATRRSNPGTSTWSYQL